MADYLKATLAACRSGIDLTVRQSATLIVLSKAKRPMRFKALNEELSISKPATTRALDRLQADGLVERIPTPADRRQVDLALTDAGVAMVVRMRDGFAEAAA